MKPKILCVCAQGLNRSKYLASYLKNKGFPTKFGGVEDNAPNPLHAISIEWADIIIVARDRLVPILKRKFRIRGKKLIVLDVTDSKRLIPKEFAHLKDLDHDEFQRRWTRPHLRNAIKPYLKKLK